MKTRYLIILLLLCASLARADVEVLGLFKGAALLKVDGEQKLLKVGQTWKGVALLKADSKEALADINGERVTLNVSSRISGSYTVPEARQVIIRKDANRQYITTAEINGRRITALVDTGANIVAMNAQQARQLGVDVSKGTLSRVTTASGVVNAHSVLLDSVNVGGIEIRHVQASVIDSPYPETVLLGVSFLQHVHLQERDGVLTLTAKY